jgi:hypothetical protein
MSRKYLRIQKLLRYCAKFNILQQKKTLITTCKTEFFILGSIKPIARSTEFLINALDEFYAIYVNSPAQKWWKFYKLETARCKIVSNGYSNSKFADSSLITTKNGKLFRVELFVMYKKCSCAVRCDYEPNFRAIGYYCQKVALNKLPTTDICGNFDISDEPVSLPLGEIYDVCACMIIEGTNFYVKRLNSTEKE